MLHRICYVIVLIFIAFLSVSGCTVHKTPVGPPVITLKTETYVVVQTAPDKFTVLTRSKTAMEEITKRLGCTKQHVCANEYDGEIWTIQRLK